MSVISVQERPETGKLRLPLGPALLVLLIATIFSLLVLATNAWDPMVFVRLGTRYGHGDPDGTIGYDGQFAYQIALQPFDAAPFLDIPPYRYQRVLYPLAARIVALGQPALIPWALVVLNLVALAVGTVAMSLILVKKGLSPWYALTVGIFAGQLVSLRLDLNEPFFLALALLGIYAFESERPRLGAGFLALSMLSKETAIAFVAGYLIYFFFRRRWRSFFETAVISLGPFLILQLVIWLNFGEIGLRSGGQGATPFSLIPFGGLLAFGLADTTTLTTVLIILGPLVLLPCLALTVSLFNFFSRPAFLPVAIILALHVLMMVTLPFSTYVDLPGVLRLTSGLVVAAVAFAAITRSRKMLNYATLWVASIVFLRFFI